MIGQTISHYSVLEKLGEGGMGVVYKARDTKLDRFVALKFLPASIVSSPDEVARFEREAKAISTLNHPNIATIYDIDDAGGKKFLALEYIIGGTLKSRLNKLKSDDQELSISEVIDYGIQMADGLAHAHSHGIVHRDIKSDNVMLTGEGKVKITDFGLAKLRGTSQLTKTGSTIGTLAYMAPEQLRGEEIDHRADLFSLGVVLYEMAALRLPFRGAHEAALTYSIANEEPAPVDTLRKTLPPGLTKVIAKCLQKERALRYQNAGEIAADLRALQQKTVDAVKPAVARHRSKLPWMIGAAIILLGAVGISLFMPASRPTGANSKTIAVLPFTNMNGNPEEEFFSDGITEDILTQLSKVADLRVISRTTMMQYKGTKKSLKEIGKELNVGVVLEGSVRRAGDQIRIVAQLIDAKNDEHLWADTYDRDFKQIFAIQSEIAQKIALSLEAQLSAVEKARLTNPAKTNAEAYSVYLQGRHLLELQSKDDLEKAIGYFEDALKIDPNYARAWAGLARAHHDLAYGGFVPVEVGFAKATQEVEKALAVDPNLAEVHTILGQIKLNHDWDWTGAGASFRRALELEPGNAYAILCQGSLAATLGHVDEAIGLDRRAIVLDPLNALAYGNLNSHAWLAGRWDEAEEAGRKVLELTPQYPWVHIALGVVRLFQSRPEEAFAEMQKESDHAWRMYGLALAYHAMGRNNDADSTLAEFIRGFQDTDAFQVAEIYAYRGETDKAFEWLDRAYRQRDAGLVWLKLEPLLHNIRKDPRYGELMKRMNLPL